MRNILHPYFPYFHSNLQEGSDGSLQILQSSFSSSQSLFSYWPHPFQSLEELTVSCSPIGFVGLSVPRGMLDVFIED
jgi:hypothetical protein